MSSPHYTHDFLLNIGGINIGVYLSQDPHQDYYWQDFFPNRLKAFLIDKRSDLHPRFKIIFTGPRTDFRKPGHRRLPQKVNLPRIKGRRLIFSNLLHPNLLLLSLYPLLERELGRHQILFLHASGVAIGNRALLFCGDSGAGKSTLLAQRPPQSVILGEDRVLISLTEGKVLAYASPFNDKAVIEASPSPGIPVSGIVFINKRDPAKLEKIRPTDAVTLILNQLLSGSYNQAANRLLLAAATILSHQTYLLSYSQGEKVSHLLKKLVK